MKKVFRAKKGRGIAAFLILASLIIVSVTFILPVLSNHQIHFQELLLSSLVTILVIGFFIWLWANTYYIVETENLLIKSGPFKWTIPIKEINKIYLDQSTIGGVIKPTLSARCMEIQYKKYKSIFITPKDEKDFISSLKLINNQIEIK